MGGTARTRTQVPLRDALGGPRSRLSLVSLPKSLSTGPGTAVQSTVGITVGQLADAFKKETARWFRSPQVSDAGASSKTSLPPWGSGGRFNCWPAFRFGTTETIRPPRLQTLGDLVHAGRTTGKADKTGRVRITGAGRGALEGLSAEPKQCCARSSSAIQGQTVRSTTRTQ